MLGSDEDARMRLMIQTLNGWFLDDSSTTLEAVEAWLKSVNETSGWRDFLPENITDTIGDKEEA